MAYEEYIPSLTLEPELESSVPAVAEEKADIGALIEKYKTPSTLDKASFMKYYDGCKNEAIGVIYSAEDLDVKDFLTLSVKLLYFRW